MSKIDYESIEFNNDIDTYKYNKFENIEYIENKYRTDYINCYFENIDFANKNIIGVVFDNCIFNNCNFNNAKIDDSSFIKTNISLSKLVGINISNSTIKDSHILDCNISYSIVSDLKINNVRIEEVNFSNTNFYDLKLKNIENINVNLSDSEIFTSLNGIDLTNCNISNIKTKIEYLKGAKVHLEQAIDLIKYLGVEISK